MEGHIVRLRDDVIVKLALDELLNLARNPSLWVEDDEGKSHLRDQVFKSQFSSHQSGEALLVMESSKATSVLDIHISEVLNAAVSEWEDAFPGLVGRGSVISNQIAIGNQDSIWKMEAEFVTLTHIVPARKVSFLRYYKNMDDQSVAVVDVSVGSEQEIFKRLPSGFVLKKIGTAQTQITWVEQSERQRDWTDVYRQFMVGGGAPYSSSRWLALIKHKLESPTIQSAFSRRLTFHVDDTFSVQLIVKKMVEDMCRLISPTIGHEWTLEPIGFPNMRVMFQPTMDAIVYSDFTSKSSKVLYDSFQDHTRRHLWDPQGDQLKVVKDYGSGTVLLIRPDHRLLLQHSVYFGDSTAMMVFSGLNAEDQTEGYTIFPLGERSFLTMAIMRSRNYGEGHYQAIELLMRKWKNLYCRTIPAAVGVGAFDVNLFGDDIIISNS